MHRTQRPSNVVIRADDPALTVRLERPWPREPYRVVLDTNARLGRDARLVHAGTPGRAIVVIGDGAPSSRVTALQDAGVTVLRCPAREGRVDVTALLARSDATRPA